MGSNGEVLKVYDSDGVITFYPTNDQFGRFQQLVELMETFNAHRHGIAKVVVPEIFRTRCDVRSELSKKTITHRNKQLIRGGLGVYSQDNIVNWKPVTAAEFKRTARSGPAYSCAEDLQKLEKAYWEDLLARRSHPTYVPDAEVTFYKPDDVFNISKLSSVLDAIEVAVPGIHRRPHCYFGSWRTSFAWHTEDMDLYSLNIHHYGQPKIWYSIDPIDGERFERLAAELFPASAAKCPAFLRHKTTVIEPSVIEAHNIRVYRTVQEEGEMIITFPYGYHAGFNQGFNVNEAINFATERWIDYGRTCRKCVCGPDTVHLDMRPFLNWCEPESQNGVEQRPEAKPAPDPRKELIAPWNPDETVDQVVCLVENPCLLSNVSPPSVPNVFRYVNDWVLALNQDPTNDGRKPDLSSPNWARCAEFPYCDVCLCFYTREMRESSRHLALLPPASRDGPHHLPRRSPRIVSSMCFVSDPKTHVLYDEHDVILQCGECGLAVHAFCYGLRPGDMPENGALWLCRTCGAGISPPPLCLVCGREGDWHAMFQHLTDDGPWIHVLCALFVRNPSYFLKGVHSIHPCAECGSDQGVTVECGVPDCPVHVHPMCVAMSTSKRHLMQLHNWPIMQVIVCAAHDAVKTVGTRVIVRHGPNNYLTGTLSGIEFDKILCNIDLDDGPTYRFSTVLPEDIKECTCAVRDGCESGRHQDGARIVVLWHDGERVPAVFLGWRRGPKFTVDLDDPPEDADHLFFTEDEIFEDDDEQEDFLFLSEEPESMIATPTKSTSSGGSRLDSPKPTPRRSRRRIKEESLSSDEMKEEPLSSDELKEEPLSSDELVTTDTESVIIDRSDLMLLSPGPTAVNVDTTCGLEVEATESSSSSCILTPPLVTTNVSTPSAGSENQFGPGTEIRTNVSTSSAASGENQFESADTEIPSEVGPLKDVSVPQTLKPVAVVAPIVRKRRTQKQLQNDLAIREFRKKRRLELRPNCVSVTSVALGSVLPSLVKKEPDLSFHIPKKIKCEPSISQDSEESRSSVASRRRLVPVAEQPKFKPAVDVSEIESVERQSRLKLRSKGGKAKKCSFGTTQSGNVPISRGKRHPLIKESSKTSNLNSPDKFDRLLEKLKRPESRETCTRIVAFLHQSFGTPGKSSQNPVSTSNFPPQSANLSEQFDSRDPGNHTGSTGFHDASAPSGGGGVQQLYGGQQARDGYSCFAGPYTPVELITRAPLAPFPTHLPPPYPAVPRMPYFFPPRPSPPPPKLEGSLNRNLIQRQANQSSLSQESAPRALAPSCTNLPLATIAAQPLAPPTAAPHAEKPRETTLWSDSTSRDQNVSGGWHHQSYQHQEWQKNDASQYTSGQGYPQKYQQPELRNPCGNQAASSQGHPQSYEQQEWRTTSAVQDASGQGFPQNQQQQEWPKTFAVQDTSGQVYSQQYQQPELRNPCADQAASSQGHLQSHQQQEWRETSAVQDASGQGFPRNHQQQEWPKTFAAQDTSGQGYPQQYQQPELRNPCIDQAVSCQGHLQSHQQQEWRETSAIRDGSGQGCPQNLQQQERPKTFAVQDASGQGYPQNCQQQERRKNGAYQDTSGQGYPQQYQQPELRNPCPEQGARGQGHPQSYQQQEWQKVSTGQDASSHDGYPQKYQQPELRNPCPDQGASGQGHPQSYQQQEWRKTSADQDDRYPQKYQQQNLRNTSADRKHASGHQGNPQNHQRQDWRNTFTDRGPNDRQGYPQNQQRQQEWRNTNNQGYHSRPQGYTHPHCRGRSGRGFERNDDWRDRRAPSSNEVSGYRDAPRGNWNGPLYDRGRFGPRGNGRWSNPRGDRACRGYFRGDHHDSQRFRRYQSDYNDYNNGYRGNNQRGYGREPSQRGYYGKEYTAEKNRCDSREDCGYSKNDYNRFLTDYRRYKERVLENTVHHEGVDRKGERERRVEICSENLGDDMSNKLLRGSQDAGSEKPDSRPSGWQIANSRSDDTCRPGHRHVRSDKDLCPSPPADDLETSGSSREYYGAAGSGSDFNTELVEDRKIEESSVPNQKIEEGSASSSLDAVCETGAVPGRPRSVGSVQKEDAACSYSRKRRSSGGSKNCTLTLF